MYTQVNGHVCTICSIVLLYLILSYCMIKYIVIGLMYTLCANIMRDLEHQPSSYNVTFMIVRVVRTVCAHARACVCVCVCVCLLRRL